MNLSATFIARPVATTLLTIGIVLLGLFAYAKLPVAPLPQVDFPTISVMAALPGASPETVATSVASPLERHLGQIADVTQMTSTSSVGQCRIVLQFGLDRDINGAARDVEAAINAARADLPTNLRSNPSYRKVNPADAPVLILALTSKTLTRGQIYNAATNVLQQRLSQINGVGQVIIGGAAMPAVRVDLNPKALFQYGIGLEDVRAALASANADSPKGAIDAGGQHYQLNTNDQATEAKDYMPLVIAYRNGAAVTLSDMATVTDSVENVRNAGLANGKPAVLVIIWRQPGANIIKAVDSVKAALPQLEAAMPSDIDVTVANDRTPTIRASLSDTQRTLIIAVALVTAVVFVFLRSWRATLIPAVVVPVSIIGTFGAMYLLGYSLDNLSLMALTVSTGFVVDDAIVVLENIARHVEAGMNRRQAALLGAREVGFTVISISISLIAVFLPILLMGGIVGRLFREFAVTLSMAIVVSLIVSLTTTPMMASLLLRPEKMKELPKKAALFDRLLGFYARSLTFALKHSLVVILTLIGAIALTGVLYVIIPKGFFPQEDTGRMIGGMQADQDISFPAMKRKLTTMMAIVQHDPAVQQVVGFTGQGSGGAGGQSNTAMVFVTLKPIGQRSGIGVVISRLRRKLSHVPGARLFLVPIQDVSVGGRQSNAAYQYTLQADSAPELYLWAPKLLTTLEHNPVLRDVNSDQQQKGLETDLVINRAAAAQYGLNMSEIDNTLYDAFGQREVSTIYETQNQYHVVMEVEPRYWQDPSILKDIFISTAGGNASGTQATQLPTNDVSPQTTSCPSSSNGVAMTSSSTLGLSASATSTYTSTATYSATNVPSTATYSPATLTSSPASYSSTSQRSSSSASASGLASSTTAPKNTANSALLCSSSSSQSSAGASNSAENAATNSIATSGNSSASAGAAVSTSIETMIPLANVADYHRGSTPLAVNHQGNFVATTISFNLGPGKSLSDAVAAINAAVNEIGLPADIHGSFAGTAATFQASLATEPELVAAALIAVYIVLGILYESLVHPITILSTLPSAGIGALLALMLFNTEFSIIALIGVILLIGIVKKNAIMMIDFALEAERSRNLSSRDAIYEACLLRFRPILMTTMAAILGAMPLAFSFGVGSELRQPLGITIIGGLIVSQLLTLYTTPVLYLYLDRFRLFTLDRWHRLWSGPAPAKGPAE